MEKVLKWIGLAFAGLLGLVVVAAIVMFALASSKLSRSYDVEVVAVAIPNDEAALARGEHLVWAISGCDGCHGDDLGGMVLLDDPAIMTFYGPNLTDGEGGAGARLSDEDWVRAVRHGVGPDGKPLILMPAQNYRRMTDEDLGAVLAFIISLPPVDNEVPRTRIGPMGYLLALTEPGFVPAALFDHAEPPAAAVEPGVSVEYGSYLVAIGTFRDCHGEHLNGRPLPPMLDEPPARNLTPAGQVGYWSEEDFIKTIRTGVTPEGHMLREPMASVLPSLQRQTDDEMTALSMVAERRNKEMNSFFDTLPVALGMIVAYGPVIALILARKRLGGLRAAVALVIWGALLPTSEHAGFAMSGSREIAAVPGVGLHDRYHFFMAGAFTLVAGIMIAIVAATQLRQGQRTGWFAILAALLVGGGFELSGAAGTLFHGFPPSWALGLVIYAYPLAWASALAISYRPVFKGENL